MIETPLVATRVGWWLGQAVRVAVAALLLAGLLGAALGAARPADLGELGDDLAARRVTEVVLTDSGHYSVGLNRDDRPVVRWRVAGSGWRTAPLADGGPGWDLGAGDPPTAETEVRRRAALAGVPVTPGPRAPHRLVTIAGLTALLLVLVLIGSPQPRRATKWAWFWLMLVPGGVTQLLWLAVESPWSSRANRLPEPLPHRHQPDDSRLPAGAAFLLALAATAAVACLGPSVSGWLAS